jgi:hypothetical protein
MTTVDRSVLPPLPPRGWGDGWDWMDELGPTPWVPVPLWGRDGWDMGQWLYVIVCICSPGSGAKAFGVATYVEGDLDRRGYTTREEWLADVDMTAAHYWRLSDQPPHVPPVGPLPVELTGPHDWGQSDDEGR